MCLFKVYSEKSPSCLQFPSHCPFWSLLEIVPVSTNVLEVGRLFWFLPLKASKREKKRLATEKYFAIRKRLHSCFKLWTLHYLNGTLKICIKAKWTCYILSMVTHVCIYENPRSVQCSKQTLTSLIFNNFKRMNSCVSGKLKGIISVIFQDWQETPVSSNTHFCKVFVFCFSPRFREGVLKGIKSWDSLWGDEAWLSTTPWLLLAVALLQALWFMLFKGWVTSFVT